MNAFISYMTYIYNVWSTWNLCVMFLTFVWSTKLVDDLKLAVELIFGEVDFEVPTKVTYVTHSVCSVHGWTSRFSLLMDVVQQACNFEITWYIYNLFWLIMWPLNFSEAQNYKVCKLILVKRNTKLGLSLCFGLELEYNLPTPRYKKNYKFKLSEQ